MKKLFLLLLSVYFLGSCSEPDKKIAVNESNKDLAAFFEKYHEDLIRLFPMAATVEGDKHYNDQLPVDFTDSYRDKTKAFYVGYLDQLKKFDRNKLNDQDKLSYDIFEYTTNISIEGYKFHDNYIPFNQFYALTSFKFLSLVQPLIPNEKNNCTFLLHPCFV